MFCKHDWKVIHNELIDSPLDRMSEMGSKIRMESMPYNLPFKTKIIILQCRLCGKLDKTIEKV